MDAFFPALVAGFLAEWGDKTQLLAMMLGIRLGRSGAIIAGIAVAALANAALAAFAGELVSAAIGFRPITLMLAIALLVAGGGGLWKQKPREPVLYPRLGAFAASTFAFFVLEFGDKTQLITLTLSARTQSPMLAAAGAALGVTAASLSPVFLRDRFMTLLPLRSIQIGASLFLIMAGLAAAVSALELA